MHAYKLLKYIRKFTVTEQNCNYVIIMLMQETLLTDFQPVLPFHKFVSRKVNKYQINKATIQPINLKHCMFARYCTLRKKNKLGINCREAYYVYDEFFIQSAFKALQLQAKISAVCAQFGIVKMQYPFKELQKYSKCTGHVNRRTNPEISLSNDIDTEIDQLILILSRIKISP